MSDAMKNSVLAICEQKRLICTLIVRCLDSIIPVVSISEILSLYLASVAEQADLSLSWSETPKTGFLVARLIYIFIGFLSYFVSFWTLFTVK